MESHINNIKYKQKKDEDHWQILHKFKAGYSAVAHSSLYSMMWKLISQLLGGGDYPSPEFIKFF